MAIYSRGRGRLELAPKQWKERDQLSPERTKVWSEPKSEKRRVVPVVYYLSRNGHLDHPHFMEVSLSSRHDGLYLKDVINRLSVLRGNGMASMYSWSSKRSYKNRFVWQDLCEGDFIYPAHGNEYVLKGSELLAISPSTSPTTSQLRSATSEQALEIPKKKKSAPWNEYRVCKSDLFADAATQTDDRKQRRRSRAEIQQIISPSSDSAADREEIEVEVEVEVEISPPPSSSSPETLESLIKPDDQDRTAGNCSSGRLRASAVLMQLVSCGSISVKEDATRGGSDSGRKEMDGLIGESSFGSMRFEDKEYFSGSLIEIERREEEVEESGGAMLKRSNSYNADRSSKLGLAAASAREMDVARAKCIPRKTNKINGEPK